MNQHFRQTTSASPAEAPRLAPAKRRDASRRLKRIRTSQTRASLESLPFVGKRAVCRGDELPRDFWLDVKSTGDFIKDQALGSQYAYLALQVIKAERFQPLLGWIALDMIEHKCPEHIAVGFFQTIADVCLGNRQIPGARELLAGSK